MGVNTWKDLGGQLGQDYIYIYIFVLFCGQVFFSTSNIMKDTYKMDFWQQGV
jgi:hypothetical protein